MVIAAIGYDSKDIVIVMCIAMHNSIVNVVICDDEHSVHDMLMFPWSERICHQDLIATNSNGAVAKWLYH